MKIATDHATSSCGIPVILDDRGHPLDYGPGLKAIRAEMGVTQDRLASMIGVSLGTVRQWEQGRYVPTATALLLLGKLLAEHAREVRP